MKLPKKIRKLLGQEEAKIKRPSQASQAFDALTPEDKLKLLTDAITLCENLTACGLGNHSEEICYYSNEVHRVLHGILES